MPQIAAGERARVQVSSKAGPRTPLKEKYEESTCPMKLSTISPYTIRTVAQRRGPKPAAKSVEGVSRVRRAGSKITCAEVQANYLTADETQSGTGHFSSAVAVDLGRPTARRGVKFFDE
jgi:hypothetical protein